jgi:hypothetical protein
VVVGERSVDVRGVTVALELDGDDVPVDRQDRKEPVEATLDGPKCTVEEDEWWAVTVAFVVEVESVHGGVTAHDRRVRIAFVCHRTTTSRTMHSLAESRGHE